MDTSPDSPSFRVRSFQNPHDLFRLLQLFDEAETADQLGEDISEATIQEQLEAPGHDPDRDRFVVGVCRSAHHPQRSARNGQSTGYIDAPGIIPDYRTPDLYSALLLHAAQWLRRHDQVLELESWGDAPETIALYQTLGFTILHQQIAYQRELVYDDPVTR
jgi:ribosomal protein S18 acetylase RimI-like enzyme